VRKATSNQGQNIAVEVNCFQALFQPTPKFEVHQYDVKIFLKKDMDDPNKAEADISRKVKEKVWQSTAVTGAFGNYAIYDGDHLAWYVYFNCSAENIIPLINVKAGHWKRKTLSVSSLWI